MKNVLLALAVLASSVGAACAKDYRCDANGGVYYTTSRVVDLPQDQSRWYVTVIGDTSNPQFNQITSWFNTHPELRKLASNTHYSVMDTNSAMYRGRREQSAQYAPPSLPCIRIQDQSGQVVYQVSGRNIPLSPEALVNSMQATCFGCLRDRRPLQSSPYNLHYHFQVQPEQQAVTPKEEDKIEDVFNKGDAMFVIPTWAYFVIGIIMLSVGIGVQWVKEYHKRA